MLTPTRLRCEALQEPMGIDELSPRLTWELAGSRCGARQVAYRVVAREGDQVIWDTGRAETQDQHALWQGPALRSRQRIAWTLAVEDELGEQGTATASFEMGLLRPDDWEAAWICDPERLGERNQGRPSYLTRGFDLPGTPLRARLYASALGLYQAQLNGSEVSRDLFRPGWTDYRRRIQYQVYDVTALLRPGANTFEAVLADGWYSGRLAWVGPGFYGPNPSFLAQLEVELEGGARVTIGTGHGWEAAWGPILATDILQGETYDASSGRGPTRRVRVERRRPRLFAQRGEPVRRTEEVKPAARRELADGSVVYDLGQNIAGRLRVKARGAPGSRLVLRHAERLEPDGRLYTTNYRTARCQDELVLGAEGEIDYEPVFTFRGFQYAELRTEGVVEKVDLRGQVLHNDLPIAGEFECSDDLVNKLWRNVLWGQRGNYLEAPTDCPQRDERLGWMGDAQVFAPTACMNMDCSGFIGDKWLRDVADAQLASGAFPDVAPMVLRWPNGRRWPAPSAAWADAGVIVPWVLYQHYGDRRLLERMFEPMRRQVEYVRRHNPNLLWENRRGYNRGFGDWLAIEEETDKVVLSTAYFAHSADLVARAAAALGRRQDAKELRRLFEAIRAAFQRELVAADGTVRGDTQTGYVLALAFDLLTDAQREQAAAHLVRRLEAAGGYLRTGFLGVGLLLPVLQEIGRLDLAYRLLLNREFPSWGYSIDRGATTIWERWDGWTTERGFQDPAMNSFNHYSLGSVGAWIYGTVGGIAPDPESPGFARALIRPRPGGGITWARCAHRSVRGRYAVEWRLESGCLDVTATVPPNCSALVDLPGLVTEVESGQHKFALTI